MQKGRSQNSHNTEKLSDSQNFLTSGHLIRMIVNISNIGKDDTVPEIGTGKGHLAYYGEGRCQKIYGNSERKQQISAAKGKMGFVDRSMRYGICGKQGLLTKRQVSMALKRAGLPPRI